MGGQTRKILFRRAGAKIQNLKESWMPSASEMGLEDQDLADLVSFLQTCGKGATNPNSLNQDELYHQSATSLAGKCYQEKISSMSTVMLTHGAGKAGMLIVPDVLPG